MALVLLFLIPVLIDYVWGELRYPACDGPGERLFDGNMFAEMQLGAVCAVSPFGAVPYWHAREWCKRNWHPASDLISVHSLGDNEHLRFWQTIDLFLGLQRTFNGTWFWTDGTSLDFTNWAGGSTPAADPGKTCSYMDSDTGLWYLADCTQWGFSPATQAYRTICAVLTTDRDRAMPRYGIANVICGQGGGCWCDFTTYPFNQSAGGGCPETFQGHCNGTAPHDVDTVCSGHGSCLYDVDRRLSGEGYCECEGDVYGGAVCERWTCDGVNVIAKEVCSGFGECIAFNQCLCDDYHDGEVCADWYCNGTIYSDTAAVCSGFGECRNGNPTVCDCDAHHHGPFCQFNRSCNGVVWHDTDNVCSGSGECLDGVCVCEAGWGGSDCQRELFLCDFIQSDDVGRVCSARGNCTGNVCECLPSYAGDWCETKVMCGGLTFDDAAVCSGRGECVSMDMCQCSEVWWNGSLCEEHLCNGVSSLDKGVVCSGNGNCSDGGNPPQCVCDPYHYGHDCQEPYVCAPACSAHGECRDANNSCVCQPGFTGDDCEEVVCFAVPASRTPEVCSGHGTCLDVDVCICSTPQYAGSECQLYVTCFGRFADDPQVCSGHGVCLENDTCVCHGTGEFQGAECEESYCGPVEVTNPAACNGPDHGVCVDGTPPTCLCDDTHTGALCRLNVSCGGIPWTMNSAVCNGRGQCTIRGCACDPGYAGVDCEFPTCQMISGEFIDEVCSGRGTCVDVDVCRCDPQWDTGTQWCTEGVTCGGIPFDSPVACSGHGICIASDNCSCSFGFGGVNCQKPVCFGVSQEEGALFSNQGCSSRGRCFGPDMCHCQSDSFGEACEEYIPHRTVTLSGSDADSEFFFELGYQVRVSALPGADPQDGSFFACGNTRVSLADATCSWSIPASSLVDKLVIGIPSDHSVLTSLEPTTNRFEFEVFLLTPTAQETKVDIGVLVDIAESLSDGSLSTDVAIAVLSTLGVSGLVVACVLAVICVIAFCIQNKKREGLGKDDDVDLPEIVSVFDEPIQGEAKESPQAKSEQHPATGDSESGVEESAEQAPTEESRREAVQEDEGSPTTQSEVLQQGAPGEEPDPETVQDDEGSPTSQSEVVQPASAEESDSPAEIVQRETPPEESTRAEDEDEL